LGQHKRKITPNFNKTDGEEKGKNLKKGANVGDKGTCMKQPAFKITIDKGGGRWKTGGLVAAKIA